MSMFCNKSRKKTPENRSFPGKRITFLSLAELGSTTGGLQTVLYLAGHKNSKTTMDIYAKIKYNKPQELLPVVNAALRPVAMS